MYRSDDQQRRRRQPAAEKRVCSHQILVLSYTNHALDQFIEELAKFHPKNIVRVGGRSKSESLKQFNLFELKRSGTYGSQLKKFGPLRRDLLGKVLYITPNPISHTG